MNGTSNETQPQDLKTAPTHSIENSWNSKIATMISELPQKLTAKLLLANREAELGGDQRSLFDLNKLVPLLLSLHNEAQELPKDGLDNLKAQVEKINLTPESLADILLPLAGIPKHGGFLKEELKAKYPHVNKVSLVSVGVLKMMTMLFYVLKSKDPADNKTTITKFTAYMDAYNKEFVNSVNSEPRPDDPIVVVGGNVMMSSDE